MRISTAVLIYKFCWIAMNSTPAVTLTSKAVRRIIAERQQETQLLTVHICAAWSTKAQWVTVCKGNRMGDCTLRSARATSNVEVWSIIHTLWVTKIWNVVVHSLCVDQLPQQARSFSSQNSNHSPGVAWPSATNLKAYPFPNHARQVRMETSEVQLY
jgi:hypothetical protein